MAAIGERFAEHVYLPIFFATTAIHDGRKVTRSESIFETGLPLSRRTRDDAAAEIGDIEPIGCILDAAKPGERIARVEVDRRIPNCMAPNSSTLTLHAQCHRIEFVGVESAHIMSLELYGEAVGRVRPDRERAENFGSIREAIARYRL